MAAAVVLVSGKARSGKDTTVEMLGLRRSALADVPKRLLSAQDGIPVDLFYTQEGKASLWEGRTVRERLIEYAERRRALDPACWAKEVAKNLTNNNNNNNKFVPKDGDETGTDDELAREIAAVSDWRFLCEIEAFKELLPSTTLLLTLRIENPSLVLDPVLNSHPSESELDSFPHFDIVIRNNGSLDELQRAADRAREEIVRRVRLHSQGKYNNDENNETTVFVAHI